jgi:hypothetical protein
VYRIPKHFMIIRTSATFFGCRVQRSTYVFRFGPLKFLNHLPDATASVTLYKDISYKSRMPSIPTEDEVRPGDL